MKYPKQNVVRHRIRSLICVSRTIKTDWAFLAAMSSSRSDDVIQFVNLSVCSFVRPSRFFNLEAFEAIFDVLMSLVSSKCFISVSPVINHCFTSVTPAKGTTVPALK